MGQITEYSDIHLGDEIWFGFCGAKQFHYQGSKGSDKKQTVVAVGRDFALAKCSESGTYSLMQGDIDDVWDCSPYDTYEENL